jgi:hypothetical protein
VRVVCEVNVRFANRICEDVIILKIILYFIIRMSFTTGGDSVKIKNVAITSEKEVTIDDIVNEAIEINKKLQQRKIAPGDLEAADKFLSEMRREHKQFADAYPIVLRYMCQMQQFHAKALRKYLLQIREHPWKGQNEYLDSQTNYVIILYKITHPRWNKTQVENLRKNVRKMLQDEHEEFTRLADKYKDEVEHEETVYQKSREETMHEFYKKHGEDTLNIKLRAVTDVPCGEIVDVDSLCGGGDVGSDVGSGDVGIDIVKKHTADDLLE